MTPHPPNHIHTPPPRRTSPSSSEDSGICGALSLSSSSLLSAAAAVPRRPPRAGVLPPRVGAPAGAASAMASNGSGKSASQALPASCAPCSAEASLLILLGGRAVV